MVKQKLDRGYTWLMAQTEPLTKNNQNAANLNKPVYVIVLIHVLIGVFSA